MWNGHPIMPFLREEGIGHFRVLVYATGRVIRPEDVGVQFIRGSATDVRGAGYVVAQPALLDKQPGVVFGHHVIVKGPINLRVLTQCLSDVFYPGIRP